MSGIRGHCRNALPCYAWCRWAVVIVFTTAKKRGSIKMKRSSIQQVPEDLRAELNKRLVASGFSGYDGFVEWINGELSSRDLELTISRSALHRHGQQFEDKLEAMRIATDQAKAIANASDDDEGAMNEALIRLVQTKLFESLTDIEDPKNLNKIGLAVSRLSRASVNQKKYRRDVLEQLELQKKETAELVESISARGGMSDDDAAIINAKLLGVTLDV